MSSLNEMSLTEYADAEKLEEKLRIKMIKIARYDQCVLIEIAATLALNQFQKKYTRAMINRDPLLQEEEKILIDAKTKAWNDRFAAESEAYPPTLESILWIVAKSGFTKEVAPLMNLSKATRECKNLQRVMREVRNRWGVTQLHHFCDQGMTSSVVRMLAMRSIDVEAREGNEEDGCTCLHTAAWNGHLDICRLLIDKGAQVDAKNDIGLTPLHMAARQAHLDICRLLIDKGAQLEARNERGDTPLHVSFYHGWVDGQVDTFRLLVEKGALIEAKDSRGNPPLYLAASADQVDNCRLLIEKGALLEARGSDNNTPLHIAAYNGHLEICRLLIDKGALLEAKSGGGRTPLHLAADHYNLETVRLLCDRGADIEARNDMGMRPLHFAAASGHISVVKELINKDFIEKRNVDINARDNLGRTGVVGLGARRENKNELDIITSYLVSLGGIE